MSDMNRDDDGYAIAFHSPARSLSFASFDSYSSPSFSLPGLSVPQRKGAWTRSSLLSSPRATPSGRLSTVINDAAQSRVSSAFPARNQTITTSLTADARLPTADGEQAWICAIAESRGTGNEVGIAMLDSNTGRCVLSQASNSWLPWDVERRM